MTENSKIEWTHHTFNPWYGCTKISPGCAGCYAETWAKRSGLVEWGGQRRRTTISYWQQPFKWNDKARADGVRRRVFCASLADVFDNTVPAEWRTDLFRLIHNTPDLDWLLLTKRIGNAFQMMVESDGFIQPSPGCYTPRPNVWIGATVVNQTEAERDVPKLLEVPARVHFLSLEPLLGEIDLRQIDRGDLYFLNALTGKTEIFHDGGMPSAPRLPRIDWVIVGGESGGGARQLEVSWVMHLQRQCRDAGVPIFIKQLGRFPIAASGSAVKMRDAKGGDMSEWPELIRVREFPGAA